MIHNCRVCKKRIKGSRKFCSQKCRGLNQKTGRIRKCLECKKKFWAVASVIKRGAAKFCSKKCYGLNRRTRVIKKCLICKKEFQITPCYTKKGCGKFCSQKCNGLSRRTRKIKKCSICKKEFLVFIYLIKKGCGRFCSKKCWCLSQRVGYINQHGYRVITVDDGRQIAEHRYVMEKMLYRRLRKGETVHHKNAKRSDNRQVNLELRMAGNHPVGWSLRQMREYLKTVPKRLGGLK